MVKLSELMTNVSAVDVAAVEASIGRSARIWVGFCTPGTPTLFDVDLRDLSGRLTRDKE